jgi:magnesium chelatase family protein
MDRIDLHIEVTPVPINDLTDDIPTESSKDIRERVIKARNIQTKRFINHSTIYANAHMHNSILKKTCRLDTECSSLLKNAMQKLNLSARAYDRIIKVSRTIADLENSDQIRPEHIGEAIHFRSLDRENWWGR